MENIVQRKDPKTGLYIKMNRKTGEVISEKKTPGPYKNIPIVRLTRNSTKIWDAIIKNKGKWYVTDMSAVLK